MTVCQYIQRNKLTTPLLVASLLTPDPPRKEPRVDREEASLHEAPAANARGNKEDPLGELPGNLRHDGPSPRARVPVLYGRTRN